MTRQIGGSPCNQGSTWGFDQSGIWVDRGCRAEFQVGGYGRGYLADGAVAVPVGHLFIRITASAIFAMRTPERECV